MMLDVVYVTYNSEKWITPCFESWKNRTAGHQIRVIVVDNASTDRTLELLEQAREKQKDLFVDFRIIKLHSNVGFGMANNMGFQAGNADIVCFFNIDTEICDTTFQALIKYVQASQEKVGVWELRQIPYEHPKEYNPVTLETSWCSGAAFAVRRAVYSEVGGFDANFFMYAEDVDLSWKVRQKGKSILYCPKAIIVHNTYENCGKIKFTQLAYSARNNLLMRYRYGTVTDVLQGYILLLKLLIKNKNGMDFRKRFLKVINSHWKLIPSFRQNRNVEGFRGTFYGLDYSKRRWGAFYRYREYKFLPQINTFIIDTHSDDIVSLLACLENQTYTNLKLYVVNSVEEINTIINNFEENEWISILRDNTRIYADHYETLLGGLENDCEIVVSVDGEGKVPQKLEYYMFSSGFYKKSLNGGWDDFLQEIYTNWSNCIEKQTVVSNKWRTVTRKDYEKDT